jgi:hypothetical protein
MVTQECVSTPLIPIYLAAVVAYSTRWRQLASGIAAALPLFAALGILRLLLVALPGAVASPMFLVHAFYQLLLGAAVVSAAALWRHGRTMAPRYALAGIAVGALMVALVGPLSTRAVAHAVGAQLDDPQGAAAFLPAFQVGLYLAIWAAAFVAASRQRFFAGLAVLGLTQVAGFLALHLLATHAGVVAHVQGIRGWAVAGPLLVAMVAGIGQPRR